MSIDSISAPAGRTVIAADAALPSANPGHKISLVGLSAFYGKTCALEGVSMTVEPRQITAFIGPSGCGKSTLLRTINRLHEVVPGGRISGSVRLGGVDLYDSRIDPILSPPCRSGRTSWPV